MFQLPYSLHMYYAAAERETATYGWAVVSAHGGNCVEFNGCRVFPADCTGFDPVAQTDAGPATTKRRLVSRSVCLSGEQHKFRQPSTTYEDTVLTNILKAILMVAHADAATGSSCPMLLYSWHGCCLK